MYVIRPYLESTAPVWSPELTKDIKKLKNVQKFALRVCTKQWSLPYDDLIKSCHVPKLSTRRDHLSLSLLHKATIINGDCVLPNAPLSPYATMYFTHSTESYLQPFARTNILVLSPYNCTMEYTSP